MWCHQIPLTQAQHFSNEVQMILSPVSCDELSIRFVDETMVFLLFYRVGNERCFRSLFVVQ